MSMEPTHTELELAALADGSLAPQDRERVLEQVRRSPELQAALSEQQRAVQMVGGLVDRAPSALRARIEAMAPERRRTRRITVPRLSIAGAAAAVLAALAVVIGLSGGGSSPLTVQQAAALTLSPATMTAPAESRVHRNQLQTSVEGVHFPYWRESFGWRSSGTRTDHIDGHAVTTVFYSNPQGVRIGYAIVSGHSWETQGGTVTWRAGVPYQLLTHDGAAVVAWPRAGHMCVVSGRGVSTSTLLALAGWRGDRTPIA